MSDFAERQGDSAPCRLCGEGVFMRMNSWSHEIRCTKCGRSVLDQFMKDEPPEKKTLLEKLEASFDTGTLGGETWYPEQALRVFQEHFNSKADDINTLIARESDTCSDLAGDVRAILFGAGA